MTAGGASTARAFAWFGAAYPGARKVDQSTVEVWAEALTDFAPAAIEGAARVWVRSEARFPSLAGFIECIRAQREVNPRAQNVYCGTCEWGWVEIHQAGRGTVVRCPNGCLPPPMSVTEHVRTESTVTPVVVLALRETLALIPTKDRRR